MRGISVQKGTEIRILLEGESWQQGGPVAGTVEAKNLPAGAQLRVLLAHAKDKKVKEKDPEAFRVIEERGFESKSAPQSVRFDLGLSCPITDKSSSLYLLYGISDSLSELGLLKLKVEPHPHIQDAIDAVSIPHRFVVKSLFATAEGAVEARLLPPSSKEFAMLKEAYAVFALTDQALCLDVEFSVNEVDSSSVGTGLKLKKAKRSSSREFFLKDVVLKFNQRLDKEKIENAWGEMLEESRSSKLLS